MKRTQFMNLGLIASLLFITCTIKNTEDPPGDLKGFTPFKSYLDIAKFAGENAKLYQIELKHVLSNGTMDLTAKYRPSARYLFSAELKADDVRYIQKEKESLPPGQKGPSLKTGDVGTVVVEVNQAEWQTTKSSSAYGSGYHKGMERLPISFIPVSWAKNEPVQTPLLSVKKLWETAIAHGVPSTASAEIIYNNDGYYFLVNHKGEKYKLSFDINGKIRDNENKRIHRKYWLSRFGISYRRY
ncbi:MAG: hypothetical protein HQK83_08840 [Fibrobacteria bacterium]|nr:hypothetical protein [Fibrobacteria bacterium]